MPLTRYVLALLVLTAPGAPALGADCRCDDPSTMLQAARAARRAGESARALEHFARLQCCMLEGDDRLDNRAVPAGPVLFELAATLAEAGRIDEAIEAYQRSVAQPTLGDGLGRQARAEMARLATLRPGALGVECVEPGLRITVTAPKILGERPCPARWEALEPGQWTIRVATPDGRDFPVSVTIEPGTTRWQDITTRAQLSFVGLPPGARSTVDGRPVETDVTSEWPPGPVTVRVTAPGHLPITRDVVLQSMHTTTLRLPLLVDAGPVGPARAPLHPAVRWTAMAAGWGALIGGGVALGVADSQYAAAARGGRLYVVADDTAVALSGRDRALEAMAAGESAEVAGFTLLGVGTALVLGGAWLFLLDDEPDHPAPFTAAQGGSL